MPTSKREKRKIKGGYFWKILWVDLDREEAKPLEFDEAFASKYIGGRGFGAKLLWETIVRRNRRSPRSRKSSGDLSWPSGGSLPSCIWKNILCLHLSGNRDLRRFEHGWLFWRRTPTGWYRCPRHYWKGKTLSYLWIDNGEVKIIPNEKLKGKGSLESEGMIKEDLKDEHIKVATIGPAGENRVRFACVTSDWGRNSGRTGIGAVMGSKNLKAIAVRGSIDLPVFDLPRLKRLSDAPFKV